MGNDTLLVMGTVTLDNFLKGQVAIERIKAVEAYADIEKYPDMDVVSAILGINSKVKKHE